jgi:hAT family C-terminal dimerisation region
LATHHQSNTVALEHDLRSIRRLVENKSENPKTLVSFVSGLAHYKEAFPEVLRLGKIAIALPVSTAACERSFSAFRHIKTWVRNSIGHSKMRNVALLTIESERALALNNDNNDDIVDRFAAAHELKTGA